MTVRAPYLFGSLKAQALLARIASHVDLWRGYGAGAYVNTSGEKVLFDIVKRNTCRNECVVFDVGANVGDFSAAAVALVSNATVHAFEPAKTVFQTLASRFAVNECVVVNNFALGSENGERDLYGVSGDAGLASLVRRDLDHFGLSTCFQERVRVQTLSDYCREVRVPFIDLLKIDVEGFEMEVLLGAEDLLKDQRIGMCSFEFGGCNLDSRTFFRDFFKFFSKYNMSIYRLTPASTIVHLPKYQESFERFTTTNYLAMSNLRPSRNA